ncbi:hypothetical protein P154DRAFT_571544 [Amniculicola lignicola CBS 123094]|uniref:Uncharacterized protein n=1 Tax=Amniculicola lignicola CBS 123094 TaxID=1392246 RepID=A0A6A5X1B3_9PLEO|nr:hypothetical protein P154DRAFT_571544 [Amniculicola lignicola CBS 123094]
MESGKTLGRDFLGRAGGMAAYGSGMLLNPDTGSALKPQGSKGSEGLALASWLDVVGSAIPHLYVHPQLPQLPQQPSYLIYQLTIFTP